MISVLLVIWMPVLAVRLPGLVVISMSDEIVGVFAFSSPAQIRHCIIVGNSVEVSNLVSFGALSQECFGNKLMDPPLDDHGVAAHVDPGMPVLANLSLEYGAPGSVTRQTPHSPEIRDLVEALIPDDGQPAFGRLVHIDSNQSVNPRAVPAAAGLSHADYRGP